MPRDDLTAYKDLVQGVKDQRPSWVPHLIYGNGTAPLYRGLGIDLRFCRDRDNFTKVITTQPLHSPVFRLTGITVQFLNSGVRWPILVWARWDDPGWTQTYSSNSGRRDWEIPRSECRHSTPELLQLIKDA